MSDQFAVRMLGGFGVYRDHRPVELPPSCRRLVAAVALRPRPVPRTWVCATLWPDAPPRKAIANLRSTLWRLRPPGADGLLDVEPQSIALGPGVSVDWHDAVDLIHRLLSGAEPTGSDPDLVADLLPLLRAGELLDGWTDPWNVDERTRYRALRMAALDVLTTPSADRGGHPHGPRTRLSAHLSGDPKE
jgi:DNA-binding SARP family transcriptional activator